MENFEDLFGALKISVLNYSNLFYNKKSFESKIKTNDWKDFDRNIILLKELFEGVDSKKDFQDFCPNIISAFVNIYDILNKDRKSFFSQLKVILGWRIYLEKMCSCEDNIISYEIIKPLERCKLLN